MSLTRIEKSGSIHVVTQVATQAKAEDFDLAASVIADPAMDSDAICEILASVMKLSPEAVEPCKKVLKASAKKEGRIWYEHPEAGLCLQLSRRSFEECKSIRVPTGIETFSKIADAVIGSDKSRDLYVNKVVAHDTVEGLILTALPVKAKIGSLPYLVENYLFNNVPVKNLPYKLNLVMSETFDQSIADPRLLTLLSTPSVGRAIQLFLNSKEDNPLMLKYIQALQRTPAMSKLKEWAKGSKAIQAKLEAVIKKIETSSTEFMTDIYSRMDSELVAMGVARVQTEGSRGLLLSDLVRSVVCLGSLCYRNQGKFFPCSFLPILAMEHLPGKPTNLKKFETKEGQRKVAEYTKKPMMRRFLEKGLVANKRILEDDFQRVVRGFEARNPDERKKYFTEEAGKITDILFILKCMNLIFTNGLLEKTDASALSAANEAGFSTTSLEPFKVVFDAIKKTNEDPTTLVSILENAGCSAAYAKEMASGIMYGDASFFSSFMVSY